MVRRLIQNFLHWLHPPETQVKESTYDRQPSSSSQPTLPASQDQQEASSSQTRSDSVPTPSLSNDRLGTEASSLEQLDQPTQSAATKTTSASQFKVLLSDYQYSPNPAIQALSHQLSQPTPPTTSQPTVNTPSQAVSDLLDSALPDLENSFSSNTDSLLDVSKTQQESSSVEKSTTYISQRISHNNDSRAAETDITPLNLTTEKAAHPETSTAKSQPHPSETTTAEPGIIKKQGVVKLLFKLKQNNHHGYIAPNDGSKDIIFHQKYVGHEIFRQLERGMEVEVTAHVTAGKAYADHIQIL
ncbi:MAG: cold shock domain-containing protein [Cyanobacteria bacterium P01_B01_bin.77]